MQSNL